MEHAWVRVGASVGVVIHSGGRRVLDVRAIREISTTSVVVVDEGGHSMAVSRTTLSATYAGLTIRLVPVTHPLIVAAVTRVRVRKVGKTLTAMADDLRYPMAEPDVEDLVASLISLRDQVTAAIADLGGRLP
jgi:hypothetical protein